MELGNRSNTLDLATATSRYELMLTSAVIGQIRNPIMTWIRHLLLGICHIIFGMSGYVDVITSDRDILLRRTPILQGAHWSDYAYGIRVDNGAIVEAKN